MEDNIFSEDELNKMNEFTSADEYTTLSIEYYKKGEYIKSTLCDEKALEINPKCHAAMYNLGITYLYRKGSPNGIDRAKAKNYLEQSAALGYLNAKKKLVDIEAKQRQCKDADKWNELGHKYYDGKDGLSEDYEQALYCYDQAIKLDPKALRNKAILFEYGIGVKKDLDKAELLYKQAREHGHKKAATDLLKIELKKMGWSITSGTDWYKLGLMYYQKMDGREEDREKERICYQMAIKNDDKLFGAYFALGLMYYTGEDKTIGKDTRKARGYFQNSADLGFEPAKKIIIEYDNNTNSRSIALWGSFAQIAIGAALTATPAAPYGAFLIGTGFSGGMSAYKSDGSTYNHYTYAKESLIGGVTSLIPFGIGKMMDPGIGSFVVKSISTGVTQEVLQNGTGTTIEGMGKAVLLGTVTGAAGHVTCSAINSVAKAQLEKVLKESTDKTIKLANIGVNGVSGAAGSTVGKMTSNVMSGESLYKDIGEAAIIGGSQGAIMGLGQNSKSTKDVIDGEQEIKNATNQRDTAINDGLDPTTPPSPKGGGTNPDKGSSVSVGPSDNPKGTPSPKTMLGTTNPQKPQSTQKPTTNPDTSKLQIPLKDTILSSPLESKPIHRDGASNTPSSGPKPNLLNLIVSDGGVDPIFHDDGPKPSKPYHSEGGSFFKGNKPTHPFLGGSKPQMPKPDIKPSQQKPKFGFGKGHPFNAPDLKNPNSFDLRKPTNNAPHSQLEALAKFKLDDGLNKISNITTGNRSAAAGSSNNNKNNNATYWVDGQKVDYEQAKQALLEGKTVTVKNGSKVLKDVNIQNEIEKVKDAEQKHEAAVEYDRTFRKEKAADASLVSGLNQKGSHAKPEPKAKPDHEYTLDEQLGDALKNNDCEAALLKFQKGLVLKINQEPTYRVFELAVRNQHRHLASYILNQSWVTFSFWIEKHIETFVEQSDFILELIINHKDKPAGIKLFNKYPDLAVNLLIQFNSEQSKKPVNKLIQNMLILASAWGQLDLLKAAGEHKIELSRINDDQEHDLLYQAVYHGQSEVLFWLIEQGFEASWDDVNLAAEQQHEDVSKQLYEFMLNQDIKPNSAYNLEQKKSDRKPSFNFFQPEPQRNVLLQQVAGQYGFDGCQYVEGDGNCFYYALIDQLIEKTELFERPELKPYQSREERVQAFRTMIFEHVSTNHQELDGFFPDKDYENIEAFLNAVRKDSQQATHFEISRIAKILHINIIILRHDGAITTIDDDQAEKTLYLGYEDHRSPLSHYWSLRGEPNIPLRPNVAPEHAA